MRRFRQASTGFCSGWMRIRGQRRRRGYDRGFVLSDHADWPGLIDTIEQNGRIRRMPRQMLRAMRYLSELSMVAEVRDPDSVEQDGEQVEAEEKAEEEKAIKEKTAEET